ncbi:hypothetical protein R1flu_011250 [Riccia fluitans]|uniref:Uncharacterized protein n=1 Tax=Riccia fluitans TaxID=41844 RepID=A0ABD1Z7A7_9MARC
MYRTQRSTHYSGPAEFSAYRVFLCWGGDCLSHRAGSGMRFSSLSVEDTCGWSAGPLTGLSDTGSHGNASPHQVSAPGPFVDATHSATANLDSRFSLTSWLPNWRACKTGFPRGEALSDLK